MRRHALQLGDEPAISSGGERPRDLREPEAEQVHGGDLAGEGLRRRDADLEAGAGVEDGVGVAGRLAAHHVGDREDVAPRSFASRIAASVSAVSPDWVIPMTRSFWATTGSR